MRTLMFCKKQMFTKKNTVLVMVGNAALSVPLVANSNFYANPFTATKNQMYTTELPSSSDADTYVL